MYRVIAVSCAAFLLTAGGAGAADLKALKDSCTKNTVWTDKACQCLADKAASLSSEQRSYIVALLDEDLDAQQKAEAAMTIPQFADVSTFMVNSGYACQGD